MAKTKTKGTAKTVSDTPVPQPITIRSTNPKIMADNILRLEESIKAADVSANPSGTAEDTLLSTIGIDGKKYELGPSAENTSYDNTESKLTATDTQAAIDEVVSSINSIVTEQEGVISATKIGKAVILSLNFGSMTLSDDGKTFTDVIPVGLRPGGSFAVTSKTYDGVNYVDCVINIGYDGSVSITEDWGAVITGLQPQYTRDSYIAYRI